MAGNPQKKSTGIVNAAIGALAVVLAILIVWMMNLVSGIQAHRAYHQLRRTRARQEPSVSSS